jgi:UMF1 family MFS transporter
VAVPLLDRLGLSRPELRGWVAYDWANSAFMTSIVQIFQIYFASVAAAGLSTADASGKFYLATAIAAAIVAVAGPFIGALGDASGKRKAILGVFLAIGALATAFLGGVGQGEWRAGLFWYAVANVAIAVTFLLYDSLLPFVAKPDEIDRVSSAGYALGYLSGGLVMALNLWWIADPARFGFTDAAEATRASFVFAALWWALFSIPFFKNVPEPPKEGAASWSAAVLGAALRLKATFIDLRRYREAFLMMIAFLIYNDGVNTVIKVGATYGNELGIPRGQLLGAILAVQFIGLPCAVAYGRLAERVGTRKAIYLALATYFVICGVGYVMTTGLHFFVLAALVGTAQGGAQALSRSLFASLIPREKAGEFFGFYGVGERFAGIAGPALFAFMVMTTGSSRNAILLLATFFLVGGFLLSRVDVDRGRALVEA